MNNTVPARNTPVQGRKGDWFQTYSGVKFFVQDPHLDDFRLVDVAHALSNMCRFGGHCRSFYSVSEHSLLVSYLLPPKLRLCGLMHDGVEGYLADLQRPVKNLPEFKVFKDVELTLEKVLAERFGLPFPFPPEVKWADNVALALEIKQLMNVAEESDWNLWLSVDTPSWRVRNFDPVEGKKLFLARYEELVYGGPEVRNPFLPEGEVVQDERFNFSLAGG